MKAIISNRLLQNKAKLTEFGFLKWIELKRITQKHTHTQNDHIIFFKLIETKNTKK